MPDFFKDLLSGLTAIEAEEMYLYLEKSLNVRKEIIDELDKIEILY